MNQNKVTLRTFIVVFFSIFQNLFDLLQILKRATSAARFSLVRFKRCGSLCERYGSFCVRYGSFLARYIVRFAKDICTVSAFY